MGLRYLDKTIIDETIQALYPGTLKTTQALPTPTPAPVKGMVGQILAAIQASSPFTNAYQSFLRPAS